MSGFRRLLGRVRRGVKTPEWMIVDLIRNLMPAVPNPEDLVRVGSQSDGGYVLSKSAILGTTDLFSPGVGPTWSFDEGVSKICHCRVHLIDGSLDRPSQLPKHFSFDRLWLATKTTTESIRLDDWVARENLTNSGTLGLQMDIEGAEWNVLRNIRGDSLRDFRFIVLELHGFDQIEYLWNYLMTIRPTVRKLLRDFCIVHVHANNCCRYITIRGLVVPSILEVSLVRRDVLSEPNGAVHWAEHLDAPNDPGKPVLSLSNWSTLLR